MLESKYGWKQLFGFQLPCMLVPVMLVVSLNTPLIATAGETNLVSVYTSGSYPVNFTGESLPLPAQRFCDSLFETSDRNPPFLLRTIVIDAGHGGYDPGALGSYSKEKNITLAIALFLRDDIKARYPQIRVIMTRSTDDFVKLDRRAAIAIENKASLFISIHCNSSTEESASGAETYAIGLNSNEENLQLAERENSVILLEKDYKRRYQGFDPRKPESYIIFSMVQSHVISRSLKLAARIQNGLGARHGQGVKQAGFLVLRKTTMPSVLVETGFISNRKQEKLLSSTAGQQLIASRIFHGFQEYKEAVE